MILLRNSLTIAKIDMVKIMLLIYAWSTMSSCFKVTSPNSSVLVMNRLVFRHEFLLVFFQTIPVSDNIHSDANCAVPN